MNNAAMAQADVSQRFALDTQGFEALKQSARQGASADTLKSAARQFEAVFTQMVLKSMRDATPQDGVFDNEQTKLYMSMFDQQLSQQLSTRGIGLADVMVRQLARAAGSALAPDAAALAAAGMQGGQGAQAAQEAALRKALQAMQGAQGSQSGQPDDGTAQPWDADAPPKVGTVVPGAVWNPTAGVRQYQAQEAYTWQGGSGTASYGSDDAPAHVSAFLQRMSAPAQAAERTSGVPAQLILGQAALESGWGRREISHPDGSTTYNVFGIKAGANWRGQVAEITTTEYVDGQPQKVKARFRAYGSYEEAFADYARLLTSNPRYAGVVGANSPEEAARGLQRAGYATDPFYGEKLVRIMKRVTA